MDFTWTFLISESNNIEQIDEQIGRSHRGSTSVFVITLIIYNAL